MSHGPKNNKNVLRIIGGKWRSRLIHFPEIAEIRPTPNRVRETLFNWLAPWIAGARCLDLFAGSGALGFEASSRGASFVLMIDRSLAVVQQLRENTKLLDATVQCECLQVPDDSIWDNQTGFDIIFLDPPFHQDYLQRCCQWLENSNHVNDGALIYIEAERELQPLPIPAHWQILKNKIAGQVGYYLVKYAKSPASP